MSTAAILAGGQARRFGGRTKALLPLGRQRIIDRLLLALGVVVDDVLVVMNAQHAPEREFLDLGNATVVRDEFPNAGPLGGLQRALTVSPAPCTLVLAGDMPFLTRRFLARLLELGLDETAADAVVPRTRDGWHPLCACYRASCLQRIEERIARGELKTSDLLRDLKTRVLTDDELASYNPDGALLFNVNTPTDYARALSIGAYRVDSESAREP